MNTSGNAVEFGSRSGANPDERQDRPSKTAADPPHGRHKRESQSRERLLQAAVFSHLGEGMIVLDHEGKILLANGRARQLLGFSEKEKLHGIRYDRRFKLRTRAGIALAQENHPVERALQNIEPIRISLMDDIYCVPKEDEAFPVTLTVSPIVFPHAKKISGVAITFYDITQEKKMDEIKSDFIYIASHQLRTPLTVSMLHTEMLLSGHGGELTKDQREFLNEIDFYNKKMAQLLTVFMTVSKIELGTFTLQEKPTDLRAILDDVFHELTTQIKSKNLRIRQEYADEGGSVMTDPEFIRIAFQNLVSNAVKYTPHEGSITARIRRDADDVLIEVEDSGCGIPEKEQSQVFSKLYRGSNTANHRWESNGLGLYLTKSIIDRCGGTIRFKSEENKGTLFTISLPLKEEAREA